MVGYWEHIHEDVKIEISGKRTIIGKLIDCGLDIVVVFDGEQYFYIPTIHIQHFKNDTTSNINFNKKTSSPIRNDTESISFRKILNNAKGLFVEIYVTGNLSLHGYIINILNNYFTFYSPVYKMMFIAMEHVKWLVPYNNAQTPYSLSANDLPLNPTTISLSRTLEEQLKKLEGRLVVFDIAKTPQHIGLLRKVDQNMVELVTARNEIVYWNQKHLKTIHLP